ncbi:cysteine hydrolase family protein [Carboxylicivirga sp. M1479]|uniref:cysteine hydrolase family protein n=1 Tax=Carboxylicivirga sp. M1479 TaxID=2594476 RepID=UPI00117791D2|nr:cysteine hydrolase family protein [Carboxylicivirga sp. M1479]TRX60352.1 cysteine hydrolase [Carboxylicivirga sp. M1479]
MKKLLLVALLCLGYLSSTSQENAKSALILIDIQDFYFPGGSVELHKAEESAAYAAKILDAFRNKEQTVIHVKHKAKAGADIHQSVLPLPNEKVFEKEKVNAFVNTGLKSHLDDNQITNLVIIGMQTHMCLEAAVRAAVDFGYTVTVVDEACTTRNLKYNNIEVEAEHVHASTMATLKSYSNVITFEVFKEKFLN